MVDDWSEEDEIIMQDKREDDHLEKWHEKNQEKKERLKDLPVYQMFDRYLDMQKKGHSFGTLICGETGLSKTFRAVGILDGVKMAYLNTYTTPLEFYKWLYTNRDKDCVIDDVEGVFRDKKSLSYIKGFCGEVKGKRLVQYNTSKKDKNIPGHFNATGTMTLIYNEIPCNAHVDAVLSRINYVRMELSFEERILTLERIGLEPYKNLSCHDRVMIIEYIKTVTSPTTRNLNIRTLFRIFECYLYDKEVWKMMADDILQADEDLSIIHEAMSRGLTPGEVCRIFRESTGGSRATFFRRKKDLMKRMRKAKVSESHDNMR